MPKNFTRATYASGGTLAKINLLVRSGWNPALDISPGEWLRWKRRQRLTRRNNSPMGGGNCEA